MKERYPKNIFIVKDFPVPEIKKLELLENCGAYFDNHAQEYFVSKDPNDPYKRATPENFSVMANKRKTENNHMDIRMTSISGLVYHIFTEEEEAKKVLVQACMDLIGDLEKIIKKVNGERG